MGYQMDSDYDWSDYRMTVEERKKDLFTFCDKYEFCEGCPFIDNKEFWCQTYGEHNVPDEEVDKSYAMMIKEKSTEAVHHPNHYNREGAMECIKEMELVFGKEAVKHFCLCNAWKYRYRSSAKNGEEDMRKSDEYMRIYKELCDGDYRED